ncbi:MAG: carboxypeptidase-like regulatory domain-containing protein [Hungatella sp.]|jgi:hypothetical protein|uniref:hypothetical protein n=1 Tax=Clostridium sp. NkU-1 TaxID=1095009 RepID=UPI0006D28640|nr:carboxypeptidase-like regulatory domain-containing protein [Hungatella sp.]
MPQKIILTGCQIICSGIVTTDFTLSNTPFLLITGTVYSPTGTPLPNAAVEILLVDSSHIPAEEKSLGVTFTLHDGTYGISLPRIDKKQYKLIAYSPV